MANKIKILLGVSGSIAAYKSAHLTREFIKAGVDVRVIMTAAAKDFITPLTLATLSRNPVALEYFNPADGVWTNHVDLGLWADAMLIAPATANTIAAMAGGTADNLLLASYLSARCPVFFAPAMDLDMYAHPATSENITRLVSRGNILIEPGQGELASGLEGKGRMAEPEHIAGVVLESIVSGTAGLPLTGRRALVTAGPTFEPIDPVRFIGNHSSGKMGYAIAGELARQGAEVSLVSGPSSQNISHPRVKLIKVGTAQQMYEACREIFSSCDISVLSAAVADYRPARVHSQKLKKDNEEMNIALERTVDIAGSLAKIKKGHQRTIGFALETENERKNAAGKMTKKKFDFIVLNSLNDKGAGFGHDTNKITLMYPDGRLVEGDLKSKKDVAKDIVQAAIGILDG